MPEGTNLKDPEELAEELGVSGKSIRSFLRREYPRDDLEKRAPWHLDEDQVEKVESHFTSGTRRREP